MSLILYSISYLYQSRLIIVGSYLLSVVDILKSSHNNPFILFGTYITLRLVLCSMEYLITSTNTGNQLLLISNVMVSYSHTQLNILHTLNLRLLLIHLITTKTNTLLISVLLLTSNIIFKTLPLLLLGINVALLSIEPLSRNLITNIHLVTSDHLVTSIVSVTFLITLFNHFLITNPSLTQTLSYCMYLSIISLLLLYCTTTPVLTSTPINVSNYNLTTIFNRASYISSIIYSNWFSTLFVHSFWSKASHLICSIFIQIA